MDWFIIGICIAVIGEGVRGIPNTGLVGSIAIIVGGVLMLLGGTHVI